MSTAGFYRAFEARYRGSRELIKKRLEAYLPFVLPLLRVCQPAAAVDLGCGRGEWIELLQERGFLPQGVDLDAAMLEACYERGLPAVLGDAIAHLQSLQEASQCMVTGFHFVEHIAFDDLQTLVAEAMRVLQPGGLLILETPNPENLVVGTSNFYLDPTHVRPIPPLLLSFLPELQGYARVKVVRLQESYELATQTDIGLMDVISGVSPDYGVVAQKAADPAALAMFNAAFATQFGTELGELAQRYDNKLNQRMAVFDQRLATSESEVARLADCLSCITTWQDQLIATRAEAARVEAQMAQLHAQVSNVRQHAEALAARVIAADHEKHSQAAESIAVEQTRRLAAAEAHAAEQAQRADAAEASAAEQAQRAEACETSAEQREHAAESRAVEQEQRAYVAEAFVREQQKRIDELIDESHRWSDLARALEIERNALRQSWSWRATAPERHLLGLVIRGVTGIRRGANHVVHVVINVFQRFLVVVIRVVLRSPTLSHLINQRLVRYPWLYQKLLGVARRGGAIPGMLTYVPQTPVARSDEPEFSALSPHARKLYNDLKTAIETRQKENG